MASAHKITSKCLHPNSGKGECSGKIIDSHTVSKSSTLQSIARNGHVYHFKPDINALFENSGKLSCIELGINKASTFPGFCKKHDKEMFAPVEDEPFYSCTYHTYLLGYRALAKEIYAKERTRAFIPNMRELDRGRSPMDQVFLQRTVDAFMKGSDLGLRDLYYHKDRYDRCYLADDYASSRFFVIRFRESPNIVFSGALYPEYDFSGCRLQSLGREEDYLHCMAVNAIATTDGGAVVFHWVGESACNEKLATSILAVPESERASAVTQFAFESFENLFISPTWWDGLNPSQRTALEGRVLCGGGPKNHDSQCFIPDGNNYFTWEESTVEHNLDI